MAVAQVFPGVIGGPYRVDVLPQNPNFYTLGTVPQPSESTSGSPYTPVGDFSSVAQGEITSMQVPILRPNESPAGVDEIS
jgi:hypothetical protein